MNLKKATTNWFFLPENEKFKQADLSKRDLEIARKKCVKDLKVSQDAVREAYFKYIWKEVLKGNLKPSDYTETEIKNEKEVSDIKIEIWQPGDEKYNPKLFETWVSGAGIDTILSNKGGATKASTIIVTGGPGAGKTTACAHLQKCYQDNYPDAKIACVQAEMKRFDIGYELHENEMPWMKELNYIILKDYGFENLKNTLIKIFTSGFDIIFLDSIENIVEKLGVYCDMRKKEAEKFMLHLFDNANDGKNNFNEDHEQVFSTIFAIQQVNKDGGFVGANSLKHETTGMLEFTFEKGKRCISFSKNRRCGKHQYKKLYFSLDKENENRVKYDMDKFNEDEYQRGVLAKEQELIKQANENFALVFGTKAKNFENEKEITEIVEES